MYGNVCIRCREDRCYIGFTSETAECACVGDDDFCRFDRGGTMWVMATSPEELSDCEASDVGAWSVELVDSASVTGILSIAYLAVGSALHVPGYSVCAATANV